MCSPGNWMKLARYERLGRGGTCPGLPRLCWRHHDPLPVKTQNARDNREGTTSVVPLGAKI